MISVRSIQYALVFVVSLVTASYATEAPKAMVFEIELPSGMPGRDGWQQDYTTSIEAKLSKAGYSIFRPFTPVPCTEVSCMDLNLVAAKAEIGVYARINHPPASLIDYLISIVIVERGKPATKREAICPRCSEFQTGERLKKVLDDLLPQAKTRSDAKLAVSSHSGRKIALYTLGGAATALAIVSAVGLGIYAKDHNACSVSQPGDLPCTKRYNNTVGIALSATGLGVGLILAPVSFVLAAKTKNKLALRPSLIGTGMTLTGEF